MMANRTANPYDRREAEKRRARGVDDVVDGGGYYSQSILADGRRAYRGFGLSQLEELLRDEFAKGFNAGEGTLERKVEEEILPRRQREAWDQGHAAGHGDGEHDVLKRIADQFEARVASTIAEAGVVLADECAEPEALRRMLSLSVRVLEQLVRSHHDGFETLPF